LEVIKEPPRNHIPLVEGPSWSQSIGQQHYEAQQRTVIQSKIQIQFGVGLSGKVVESSV